MPTRILIVGTGAIGAFFGSRLATVPQVLVSALCRSNYDAVKTNGLRITSPKFGNYTFKPEYTFRSPQEARKTTRERNLKWDYLLVATKVLPEVEDSSGMLEGLVGEETSIVLVQNGVGIEEPYSKRFPRASVLSGVTIASVVQDSPGVVTHNRWTRLSVGPYLSGGDDGGTATQRMKKFADLLTAGGIQDVEQYDHAGLQFVRWHKIAINAAMNPSSVLSGGCGNQALAMDPDLAVHIRGVMEEVLNAATVILSRDVPWKELKLASPDQIIESVKRNDTGSRPSMWHDWINGRKMELEAILGNPIRMARQKGLEMPRVQSMYALLKMAQERRDAARGAGDSKL